MGSYLSSFQHQRYSAKCPLSYIPNPQGSSLLGHLFSKERAQAQDAARWVLGVHEGWTEGGTTETRALPTPHGTQDNISCRNCYAPVTATSHCHCVENQDSLTSSQTRTTTCTTCSRLGHYKPVPYVATWWEQVMRQYKLLEPTLMNVMLTLSSVPPTL